jgi:hypothetical protein
LSIAKHLIAHGSRERERIRVGAHEQRHAVHTSLRETALNLSGHFVSDAFLANVADDTDDRAAQSFRLFTTKRHALPSGSPFAKKAFANAWLTIATFCPSAPSRASY